MPGGPWHPTSVRERLENFVSFRRSHMLGSLDIRAVWSMSAFDAHTDPLFKNFKNSES